jgi:hypothetical protein
MYSIKTNQTRMEKLMKREIHDRLYKYINDTKRRDVIIIEGARQVGKSYLVNHVLKSMKVEKHVLSFDLEKEPKLRHQINQTDNFIDFRALMMDQYGLKNNSVLFFDEAQECQKLAMYVKSFKEDWHEVKVILTGSSMNRFFPKTIRIPVGRMQSMCVYPFSFSEFIRFIHGHDLADFIISAPETIPTSRHIKLLEYFDIFQTIGGYPEAVKAFYNNESARDIIEEIIASLEEDFQRKEGYQPGLFGNALRGVANHIGSPSKLTHVDATKYYARQVIELMKTWHIILEVDHYSFDPNHSNFLPKRYLHDVGVANLFRTLSVPPISIIKTLDPLMRTPLGGLFENAVLINLLQGESAYKKISTWKKSQRGNIEVDFIVDAKNSSQKIPIECKATTKIQKKHIKNILHYLDATCQKFGIVISAAPLEVFKRDNDIIVLNLPIYMANAMNINKYSHA